MHKNESADILLVGNCDGDLERIEAALDGLGLNLVKAASRSEARLILEQTPVAAVLFEVERSGSPPIAVAALLRWLTSDDTPILFLTSNEPGGLLKLPDLIRGTADIIPRPIVPELLRARLAALLELARTRAALHEARAQLESQASEPRSAFDERFRLLIEGTRDYAIFVMDAQGHIASWNLGASLMYGYTASETIGRHYSSLWKKEDVERGDVEVKLRTALREGHYSDEGWRVRKDGSEFWAGVFVTPLHDRNGNLCGFGEIVRDITDRKTAESQLAATQTAFRDFLNNCPALAFIRDSQGQLVYVNTAYEQFFGAPLAELKGTALPHLVPEPTAQALSRLYQQVLTEMRAMQEVHTIPSPDGS